MFRLHNVILILIPAFESSSTAVQVVTGTVEYLRYHGSVARSFVFILDNFFLSCVENNNLDTVYVCAIRVLYCTEYSTVGSTASMIENKTTNSTSLHQARESSVQHEETPQNGAVDTDDVAIEIFLDCKRFFFLAFFLFFVFPLLPLFLATVYGGLLVLCEGDATFREGFLYVVSNLLGMANPLTDYNPSGVTVAVIIDMYVAITALVCFGIMLNVVNLFEVPVAINHFIERFVRNPILVPLVSCSHNAMRYQFDLI